MVNMRTARAKTVPLVQVYRRLLSSSRYGCLFRVMRVCRRFGLLGPAKAFIRCLVGIGRRAAITLVNRATRGAGFPSLAYLPLFLIRKALVPVLASQRNTG